jgi:ABC-type Fe3+ transport system substrate-binding protein
LIFNYIIIIDSKAEKNGLEREELTMSPRLGRMILRAAIFFFLLVSIGCSRKPLDEGARAVVLSVITPHNENIRYEFSRAFSEYARQQYGWEVSFQWRDVGGGSSSILQYLRNVYSQSETSGIDVLFGGGEYTFQYLDAEGLLEELDLPAEVWEAIPAEFGGMEMYSPRKRWVGNVLSSFGFLYNKELLRQLNLPEPSLWEDLGRPEFFDLVILADPTQSGSQAAANEMIVQSAPDWPQGWRKLLLILSNAKKFLDNSGAAARAPSSGECAVAVCIDFYGMMYVSEAPDKLGYVSPKGQTAYTPDPIGVLKNPPHREAAQAFVQFVMSQRGQGLWALPPGHPDGPQRYRLNRTPIRKDFYALYAESGHLLAANPYESGSEMVIDAGLREVRYEVLARLVYSAAIENASLLREAKRRILAKQMDESLVARLTRLPENIDTVEEIYQMAEQMKDPVAAERITTEWTAYFREQYRQIQ